MVCGKRRTTATKTTTDYTNDMLTSLHLISGLSKETLGEILLTNILRTQKIPFCFSRLFDYDQKSFDSDGPHAIVLVLPLMGDNDLLDDLYTRLSEFVSFINYQECSVVVIAHGDRHASDEFITAEIPFSIKIRRILSGIGAFEMLDTKLDRFTALTLAREIMDIINFSSSRDILELNRISSLLPRAPKWHVRKRLLDLYDPFTGSSLLKCAERDTQRNILKHIQRLKPRTLKLTYSDLEDAAFNDMEGTLDSEVVDLSSNKLSWEAGVSHLGGCRALNLAANSLRQLNLSQLPPGLEHLYLHKNDIHEFTAKREEVACLKSLTLYRNSITAFGWPAGGMALSRLNLGANPISALPETLSTCNNLEFLGLARTQISRLPDWIFSSPSLRELDISYIEDRIPRAQIELLCAQNISLVTRPGLVVL